MLKKPDSHTPTYLIDVPTATVTLLGRWRCVQLSEIQCAHERLSRDLLCNPEFGSTITIDFSQVSELDTYGAYYLNKLISTLMSKTPKIVTKHISPAYEELLHFTEQRPETASFVPKSKLSLYQILGRLKAATIANGLSLIAILGCYTCLLFGMIRHPSRFPHAETALQTERMCIDAIVIISLMSFLVGAVITQQSVLQLRYFGAQAMVPELSSTIIFRELSILITAIMIAGRSGSAVTAEIGSMKLYEELNAMKIIGLSVERVLLFPRITGLVISLPLLTLISNIVAIFGSLCVAHFYAHIPYTSYLTKLQNPTMFTNFAVGLIKAPFMALTIGFISIDEGLTVYGSTESLSHHVTASVVKSIFAVIILDSIFSLLLMHIGI